MDNRVATQDALPLLATRGLLRSDLPGEYGAELWQRHMISGARLLESLGRRAEQAGMPADVFDVCAALIGGLARRPDTRGLPDLLLLATRCAVGADIRGVDVPGSPRRPRCPSGSPQRPHGSRTPSYAQTRTATQPMDRPRTRPPAARRLGEATSHDREGLDERLRPGQNSLKL